MSVSTPKPPPAEPKLPDGFEPRMLSFDVYGALVNTPPANLAAFRTILADVGRPDLDPEEFYSFWEERNIAHYREPYRTYKDICRLSLSEAYERFGVATGQEEAIQRYFDCFSSMELYPDVLTTLMPSRGATSSPWSPTSTTTSWARRRGARIRPRL